MPSFLDREMLLLEEMPFKAFADHYCPQPTLHSLTDIQGIHLLTLKDSTVTHSTDLILWKQVQMLNRTGRRSGGMLTMCHPGGLE